MVLHAIRRKMVEGTVLYTDSTSRPTPTNTSSRFRRYRNRRDYLETLEEDANRDREAHHKKPLPKLTRGQGNEDKHHRPGQWLHGP
jgi:hypothetical protein